MEPTTLKYQDDTLTTELPIQGSQIQGSLKCCYPMATHQIPLSPVPWEQDGFLQVKVEDEETSLS